VASGHPTHRLSVLLFLSPLETAVIYILTHTNTHKAIGKLAPLHP
jgi:hypothetical protein